MLKKAPDVETSKHFSYSLYNKAMMRKLPAPLNFFFQKITFLETLTTN